MDETEILSASITVTVDGQRRTLPILRIKRADEWRTLAVQTFEALGKVDTEVNGLNMSAAMLLDLVIAYDRDSILGGREWLEEHATDEEIYDAFLQMWHKSFPYKGLMKDMLAARPSAPVKSPNGRSPIGVSTLIDSAAD